MPHINAPFAPGIWANLVKTRSRILDQRFPSLAACQGSWRDTGAGAQTDLLQIRANAKFDRGILMQDYGCDPFEKTATISIL